MKSPSSPLYQSPSGPFTDIAKKGTPLACIALPAEPSSLERFAAKELQSYLQKISGAGLPIVKEDKRADSTYSFFIGKTSKAVSARINTSERNMGRDGFTLRSRGDGLIILGRDDLGTVFGVYELLEQFFDVRWFMPGELGEHIPKSETLKIGEIDLVYKPSFRVRRIGVGEWSLRQRMNVYVTAEGRDVGVNWKWDYHTFVVLIPPSKYYAKHPEYFALVNGKREVTDSLTHGNQLCTSNPEVIREVAKNLIAVLDAEPGIEIITLSPNDGGGFCECEKCTALDEPRRDWFGHHSSRLTVFNNAVAKIVRKKHPKVLMKVGAYATYTRPPLDKDYRPEPNLFFQLCHLYFCHNHPVAGDGCKAGETYPSTTPQFRTNSAFRKILNQWLKLSPHLFIYEYYAIRAAEWANMPWPVLHTIRKDIPYYRDRGIEGFYTQLFDHLWHRHGLNYYLAAKLCWNADLDVDALLDDYFTKFYGPAAAPMRDYFMAMERGMEDWNGCISYGITGVDFTSIAPKIFTPKILQQMLKCVEKAERLVAGKEIFSQRVAMVRRMNDETCEALAKIRNSKKSPE